MRIAFDLDGTLVPASGAHMPVEALGLFSQAVSRERIRAGAPALLRALRRRGHRVWIYTTSHRSPARLRLWFASFGVRLEGIVNQPRHLAAMTDRNIACSKYPPAFGIDLLVDDAEGVALEGKRFGFSVLCISEDDDAWCARVSSAVVQFESGVGMTDRRGRLAAAVPVARLPNQ
jgi:phosphoglycolate phosphatase-like HAD superfamily hydrolase